MCVCVYMLSVCDGWWRWCALTRARFVTHHTIVLVPFFSEIVIRNYIFTQNYNMRWAVALMMKMKNLFSFHPGGGDSRQMQFSTMIRTSTILIENNFHISHWFQMKCCVGQNYFQIMLSERPFPFEWPHIVTFFKPWLIWILIFFSPLKIVKLLNIACPFHVN